MGKVAIDALFSLQEWLRLGEGRSSPISTKEIERIYRELEKSLGRDPKDPPVSISFPSQFIEGLKDVAYELDRLLRISPRSAHRIVLEVRMKTRHAGAAGRAAHILRVSARGESPRPDPMGDRAAFYAMCGLSEVLQAFQNGQCLPNLYAEVKEVYHRLADALGRDPDDLNTPMARSVQQEVLDLVWELQQLAEIYPRVAHPIALELREKRQVVESALIAKNILKKAAGGTWSQAD